METLRRTRIADLFRTKPIGTTVKVKGWYAHAEETNR